MKIKFKSYDQMKDEADRLFPMDPHSQTSKYFWYIPDDHLLRVSNKIIEVAERQYTGRGVAFYRVPPDMFGYPSWLVEEIIEEDDTP